MTMPVTIWTGQSYLRCRWGQESLILSSFLRSTGYDGDITTEGVAFDEDGNVDVVMLNKQFDYIKERIFEH